MKAENTSHLRGGTGNEISLKRTRHKPLCTIELSHVLDPPVPLAVDVTKVSEIHLGWTVHRVQQSFQRAESQDASYPLQKHASAWNVKLSLESKCPPKVGRLLRKELGPQIEKHALVSCSTKFQLSIDF
jgi:hypothetical protein